MPELTAEGRRELETIAARTGVSTGAAEAMLEALVAGHGSQAQFSHPELGGMGQWSRGGMLMVGDMFNNALKAKVGALADDLAALLARGGAIAAPPQSQGRGDPVGASLVVAGGSGDWWPSGLGAPSSVGAQNSLRYAVFPSSHRVAIDQGGKVTVHDTGDHVIGGVSQAQSGDQTLTFTSQRGTVRLADLPVVGDAAGSEPSSPEPSPSQSSSPRDTASEPAALAKTEAATAEAPAGAGRDVVGTLERLAGLRDKGILSAQEFDDKKRELLARL